MAHLLDLTTDTPGIVDVPVAILDQLLTDKTTTLLSLGVVSAEELQHYKLSEIGLSAGFLTEYVTESYKQATDWDWDREGESYQRIDTAAGPAVRFDLRKIRRPVAMPVTPNPVATQIANELSKSQTPIADRQTFALGPLSYSPQKGVPGRCLLAQVWGPDGKALADVEPTANPDHATAYASLFAAAPDLLDALQLVVDRLGWYTLSQNLREGEHERVLNALAKATN